jgi:hypothetical protein
MVTGNRKTLMQRSFEMPSGDELAAFIACLDEKDENQTMAKLAAVFGDELLVFLEVFAGRTVRVPSMTAMTKTAFEARLWAAREAGVGLEKLSDVHNVPEERIAEMQARVERVLLTRGRRRFFGESDQ